MDEHRVRPAACRTMDEVRSGVDRLDEEIVARLGERFRYMDAAARKAEVLANVRRLAAAHGVPAGTAADLYERLVEASIAYEFDRFDATRG